MKEELKQKIEKLPVWAQNLIRCLENEAETYKEALDATTGNQDSLISYGFEQTLVGKRPIPDNCGPICFQVGKSVVRINIEKEMDGESAQLRIASDFGKIAVIPWASNSIKVKVEDR